MVQFGRLLSFPLEFKNLEEKIKDVKIDKLVARRNGTDQIVVDASANGHPVMMVIYDKEIQASSPVKLSCGCQFFTYNLAYGLYKQDSLLNPESFTLRPPKSKNTSLVLSGCKHIIKIARELYARKSQIII